MAERIDYVEFPSSDGPASTRFFAEAFGWGLVDYGPGYTGLGGAGLDGAVDAMPGRAAAPLIGIRTDDLDAAEARVIAAGGVITQPQFDFPGGRRFHFREPGGTELSVWVAR